MTRGTTPASRSQRLRALIDTAPALYCVAPAEAPLAFEYVGTNCRALLGYPARKVTGAPAFWRERIHPSDRRRVERAFGLVGRAPHSVLPTVRYRLRGADGRYRQIEHHCSLARLGPGDERMLVSVCIVTSGAGVTRIHPLGSLGATAADNDELRQISRVAERLAICTDIDELQQAFDDTFVELFAGDGAAVLTYEPKDRSLRVAASCGDAPAAGTVYPATACLAVLSHATHRNAAEPHEGLCDHVPPTALRAYVCVPLLAERGLLGVFHLSLAGYTAMNPQRLTARSALAERIANLLTACLMNIRMRESLQMKALRDPLTRLFNRRHFDESLDAALTAAGAVGGNLALLMLDVDRFKDVNDQHGHAVGDAVLVGFADYLAQKVRAGDSACRYGGEEFALIMPGIAPSDALARAEAIRSGLHHWQAPIPRDGDCTITASIGVAAFPVHGRTAHELLAAADGALYRAKRAGRDCVVAAEVAKPSRPALPVARAPRGPAPDEP